MAAISLMLCVMQGRVKSTFFTEDDAPCDEVILHAGDVLVLLAGGHSYDILEDDTFVLEVKNGPYLGADVDRRRLNGD